jgi:geranylgeranyl diphosphate synthase type I
MARLGAVDLTAGEIALLQQIFEETGARAEVERRVEQLTNEALAALDLAPLDTAARDQLVELAAFVAGRDY